MEFTREKRKKLAFWVIGVAAACIIIFLILQNIGAVGTALSVVSSIFLPLILGCAFAMILNVPMRFFESLFWPQAKRAFWQKLRRPLAFLLSLALIIGIVAGIVWLVIPEVINAVKVVVQTAIDYVNELSAMDEAQLAQNPLGNLILSTDWNGVLQMTQSWLQGQGGTIVNTAFGTISSLLLGMFEVLLAFIFSIYVLFNKDKLKRQATRLVRVWLPQKWGEGCIHAVSVANVTFRNFISGQTLEAAILGTLCMLGMFALGIPYAPMVGAMIFVTAFIPIVGNYIGVGIGAFMIVTVEPVKAIVFVVFFIILQQIEGNLIYPHVMGSKVKLPGIWVIAAVAIGSGIGGPLGMLLSIPLASTAYILLKESTAKREKALAEAAQTTA